VTIRTLSSRRVYGNPWLSVREDEIERQDGSRGVHAVVDKHDGAVVAPWDGERLTLVGQVKYPVGRFTWELPQGATDDDPSATAEETARAELLEETGLRAGTLTHLGRLCYAPGIMSQLFDAWLATDLEAGEAQPEATEVGLETRAVTPAELDKMLLEGEIVDAATLAVMHLLRARGHDLWA
jgi:8-oxo-dGTP pyrophosphatase MutT (NUDIX family)